MEQQHQVTSFDLPIPCHRCISLEQYRHLEERVSKLQADIQTMHRMVQDLSALVYRQLEEKIKPRRLSETAKKPSSHHTFTGDRSPGSVADLDLLNLVTSDTTEVMDIGDSSTKVAIKPAPSLKKLSAPLAIPDATLSAQWLSMAEMSTSKPLEETIPTIKLWFSRLQLPSRLRKVLPFSKEPKPFETISEDDNAVTRRFSVSSSDLVECQSAAMKQKANGKHEEFDVSPEEIMSARKLEGELDRFTLRHDAPYRTAWDLFVILIILLDLVFTPLSIGFDYTSKLLDCYNILETVVFAVDFVVRMLSSYTDDHGNLISGPTRTAMNYLTSGWALVDFLSWFPLELFVNSSHTDIVGFLKVFRLAKVSHLVHRLNSSRKAGILRFAMLLGLVLTIAHLLTCYWSWVAVSWREHLEEGLFVPKSLFDEYSLCWSLVIGCVNASPPLMYSTTELISVGCFMLVGNILQASVFGAVAALIASMDENEVAFSKKMITVSERCRFLGIPDHLAKRIRGYYENLWRETKSISGDADTFINELSPALICEVKFQLYRDMLRRIPFLSAKTLAPAVIEVLILRLRTVIYMQDDVLIRKGEFGDWMGFIGSKGSVGVLNPNSDAIKIIRILRKGDYFGEMALLQHTKRSATTVALTWVQIHVLCRQDLDYVKELYPTQTEILECAITKYKHMQSGMKLLLLLSLNSITSLLRDSIIAKRKSIHLMLGHVG